MLISESKKYVFLSNPKTGTTAIQDKLMNLDKSARMNRIYSNGVMKKFPEHGNGLILEEELGSKVDEYQIFTFIRDPYDKIVSSYFFYKNGKPLVNGNLFVYFKGGYRIFLKAFVSYLNILLARLLPFHVWSLLRRVKSNEKYLVGSNGEFLVNYIGQTENLSQDFNSIILKLGLPAEMDEVERMNSSNHKSTAAYFQRKWHLKQINKVYKRELMIYELVRSKPSEFDYRGLKINEVLK